MKVELLEISQVPGGLMILAAKCHTDPSGKTFTFPVKSRFVISTVLPTVVSNQIALFPINEILDEKCSFHKGSKFFIIFC